MSWLSDKWLRNRGPIEAGVDPTLDGPFSDNVDEEITPRTMRNFAYELSQILDQWQLVIGVTSHPALTDRDTADSHPASAVSLLDVGDLFASDDLEGAMAETVTSIDVRRIVKMSQADYTALPIKDPETLYMLTPS